MSTFELQPEILEVLQAEVEETHTTIPVCVEEVKSPVRVQILPRKGGSTATKLVGTTPVQVMFPDHFRYSVKLVSFDQDMLIAFNETSAESTTTMSRWPKGIPYECTSVVDIFVASFSSTTSISITSERWSR